MWHVRQNLHIQQSPYNLHLKPISTAEACFDIARRSCTDSRCVGYLINRRVTIQYDNKTCIAPWKSPGGSKIDKKVQLFGSAPNSDRWTSIETELNHCTATEIRWCKNKGAWISPSLLLVSLQEWHMTTYLPPTTWCSAANHSSAEQSW